MEEKACFGVLDKVFPVGEEGLRQVPPGCFRCEERIACLQAALETGDGLKFQEEVLARTPPRGFMERVRRWSEKKTLSRRMNTGKRGK
ncbi:MAG: hypothetical protein JRF59_01255 [Deltaproteobacteria bacterium]|nr:hypothetical protein [Deltaproteobacteria bacterium]MBW1922322.1 hypothetical protein [Deltaproteobacteria bacterium]MBW1948074.1 hypothetical protein [Deltaproteobacteria bacterium]MBW2006499.1 hypothetical protein [Deltaproteobacteria bacterium]MBW2101882.1 hypothetical protein [Deltaproteobacteria bacterium]